MSDNDDTLTPSKEPTMRDLFEVIKKCANKDDINEIKAQITAQNEETSIKIATTNKRIDDVVIVSEKTNERIEQLEASMEVLKQDQLRNNICISGVPIAEITNTNTSDIIISIAKTLGVEIAKHNFTSYPVAGNKFIIVTMYNSRHKQTLLNKIRVKKSLMVEEVFKNQKSNSQLYLNDHLTPYFNKLFMMARKAKVDGKIASASSYGGKIRARKTLDDAPIVITNERQLQTLIDSHDDTSTNTSVQQTKNDTATHQSTPKPSTSAAFNTRKNPERKQKNPKLQQQKNTAAPKPSRPYKRKNTAAYDANRDLPNKKHKNDDNYSRSSSNGNLNNTQ